MKYVYSTIEKQIKHKWGTERDKKGNTCTRQASNENSTSLWSYIFNHYLDSVTNQ